MLELSFETVVDLRRSGARNGSGLLETLAVRGGRPRRLARHLARLGRGAAFLGMEPPPSAEEVHSFIRGAGLAGWGGDGILRLVAVDRSLLVLFEAGGVEGPGPVAAGLSRSVVRFSGSPLCRFKTLSRLENTLIAREAGERGLFDLVTLNERGLASDGGRTSLFALMGGELLTPPLCDGALPGVAREVFLEAGLAREESLGGSELEMAGSLFLANSLRGVFPVVAFEGSPREIDGPTLARLAEALERAAD